MSFARVRGVFAAHTILRSLLIVALAGLALWIISVQISAYNDLQLATGAYYFAALAGLTVLAGLSGQISLGHGALMAIGAYTVALLIGNEGWAVIPALVASAVVTGLVGIPVGAAASRLRGPYLAGATLAFAVGLPALADKFPKTFGGENGLSINPSVPPASLGANFPLERWEAWIACGGALVVVFVLYNVIHSGIGRSLRAVRDDEIAASLSGLHVGRIQTARVHAERRLRRARRRPADSGAAARPAGSVPDSAVAGVADRRRAGRARLADGRGLGRGAADAPAELDQRPRQLVLALQPGLTQHAAGDLRDRPDRRDARVAVGHPGRGDRDRQLAARHVVAARRATADTGRPTERGVVSPSVCVQIDEIDRGHAQQRGLDVA